MVHFAVQFVDLLVLYYRHTKEMARLHFKCAIAASSLGLTIPR